MPLNDMQRLAGRHAQFYEDWLKHPDYDEYWNPSNVEERFESIGIPVHTFGGWYDILAQGTLKWLCGSDHKGQDGPGPGEEQDDRGPVGTWSHAQIW